MLSAIIMKKTNIISLILLFYCSISIGQMNDIDWNDLSNLSNGTEIAVGVIENGKTYTYGFLVETTNLKRRTTQLNCLKSARLQKYLQV